MRIALWVALVVGAVLALVGLIHFQSLQPQLPTTPAIVLMPQIIQAVLVAGFGAVLAVMAVAGLALLNAAAEQLAALERIARQAAAPPPPTPGIRDPMPPNYRRTLPPGTRPCPSCGEMNQADARTCSKCGTTLDMARG
jgi:hypothetical protein